MADEKHLLKPLPDTVYEIKYYKQYKVASNNHICLFKDRHYYSVPYTCIGKFFSKPAKTELLIIDDFGLTYLD
ncbi:hypothetical protein [Thermophagus sp. OGC60D27]|uniref:hypothetical protein n=1 Tax=Thermophagus sp. OGC60D27 TaxID=3458415 RepID=UPI004037AF04